MASTVSDWLWLKLSQVPLTPKGFTLPKLQELVREKFDTSSDAAECFLVYLLTGQFEQAIEKLSDTEKYRTHAVHMAIVLRQNGLLIVYDEADADSSGGVDFVALIKSYVRPFRKQNTDVAVEYYYQLASFPVAGADLYDHKFRSVFELCLYKLARDTRNVAGKLFGEFEPGAEGGVHLRRGLVWKFMPDPEPLMVTVGKKFEAEGRLDEALGLLEVAGDSRRLLEALLRILSAVLVLSVESPVRRTVASAATSCAKRWVFSFGRRLFYCCNRVDRNGIV